MTVRTGAGPGPGPGPVLVSLRPSAVTVHLARPEGVSTRNVWRGEITTMELLADRVRLQVAGPPAVLVDVTQAAVAELGLDAGVSVWLTAKAVDTVAYPDPRPPGRARPPG